LTSAFAQQAKAAAGGPKLSDGVVKIGVLTDMSGLYSDWAAPALSRRRKWRLTISRRPRRARLSRSNSFPRSPEQGGHRRAKVREWYDTQGVDMVTDALNSAVALAVAR